MRPWTRMSVGMWRRRNAARLGVLFRRDKQRVRLCASPPSPPPPPRRPSHPHRRRVAPAATAAAAAAAAADASGEHSGKGGSDKRLSAPLHKLGAVRSDEVRSVINGDEQGGGGGVHAPMHLHKLLSDQVLAVKKKTLRNEKGREKALLKQKLQRLYQAREDIDSEIAMLEKQLKESRSDIKDRDTAGEKGTPEGGSSSNVRASDASDEPHGSNGGAAHAASRSEGALEGAEAVDTRPKRLSAGSLIHEPSEDSMSTAELLIERSKRRSMTVCSMMETGRKKAPVPPPRNRRPATGGSPFSSSRSAADPTGSERPTPPPLVPLPPTAQPHGLRTVQSDGKVMRSLSRGEKPPLPPLHSIPSAAGGGAVSPSATSPTGASGQQFADPRTLKKSGVGLPVDASMDEDERRDVEKKERRKAGRVISPRQAKGALVRKSTLSASTSTPSLPSPSSPSGTSSNGGGGGGGGGGNSSPVLPPTGSPSAPASPSLGETRERKSTLRMFGRSLLGKKGSSKGDAAAAVSTAASGGSHDAEAPDMRAKKFRSVEELMAHMQHMDELKDHDEKHWDEFFGSFFDSANTADNLLVEKDDGGVIVRGLSPWKLVQWMTVRTIPEDHDIDYDLFVSIVLCTYRKYLTPLRLLHMLIMRWNIAPVGRNSTNWNSMEQWCRWHASIQYPVQECIMNILHRWVDDFYYHDMQDQNFLDVLLNFLDLCMTGEEYDVMKNKLKRLIARKTYKKKEVLSKKCPKSFLPKVSASNLSVVQMHPTEVARQLTLLSHGIYKKIAPIECLDQGWLKKDKKKRAPHILEMIEMSNAVSNWVAEDITSRADVAERAKSLNRFILIAGECRALSSFDVLMAIIAGLQSAPIWRLQKTWELLPEKTWDLWDRIRELMASDANHKNYRDCLRETRPPCVPYLGIQLTDLVFVDDGNTDLEGDVLNFVKMKFASGIIYSMEKYKTRSYRLLPVPEIQAYILTRETVSWDELLAKSKQVEKKT
eukprot:TRINITY_DN2723_c0_g3_i2.p1 TRINITY_DN2723_c0_g3~~TRINITY_DN2723_c0_g3_i2.p1  ORF type:complete len:993 (-),score=245.75 TRINITY_DN2723_c0_g3_i2:335-3313(-)